MEWEVLKADHSISPSLRYDVALLYLQQADWNTDVAIESFREDERWEKEHPIEAQQRAGKGKGSAKSVGMSRFVGAGSSSGR